MTRPKKNTAEDGNSILGNKLTVACDIARAEENAQQTQNREGDRLPFKLETYASMPLPSKDGSSFLICAHADIEAKRGRMMLPTGIVLNDGFFGIVVPTIDNAAHGLRTESCRLTNSDVISTRAFGLVKLVINIGDDTKVQELTSFGSRYRDLVIPKGTPLAELIVFKIDTKKPKTT